MWTSIAARFSSPATPAALRKLLTAPRSPVVSGRLGGSEPGSLAVASAYVGTNVFKSLLKSDRIDRKQWHLRNCRIEKHAVRIKKTFRPGFLCSSTSMFKCCVLLNHFVFERCRLSRRDLHYAQEPNCLGCGGEDRGNSAEKLDSRWKNSGCPYPQDPQGNLVHATKCNKMKGECPYPETTCVPATSSLNALLNTPFQNSTSGRSLSAVLKRILATTLLCLRSCYRFTQVFYCMFL